MTVEMLPPLLLAIECSDGEAIERLVASGAHVNGRDEFGEPVLFRAVETVQFAAGAERDRAIAVVSKLAELGANANALAADGASILIGPILGLDSGLVELLLRMGVDPNQGCGEPFETVYDAASFDYQYEAWFAPSLPQLVPPEGLGDDEDAYLAWLDQEAHAKGYLRPEILVLLRQFGALTGSEMAKHLGGRSGQGINWTASGWTLAS
jgi:hypothetical protein